VSPAAGGALAFGVERQPSLQPVVCRSRTAWICPGSYADLATGFTTNRGAFNSDIGMTTRSALIARKQLNPYEEARAVKAMLARGLSEDGVAQALGWPKARVTARMRLLDLPDRAQRMVGEGELSLSCVDVLRQIGSISPPIQELVVEYLDHDDTAWARDRLEGEPGQVIGQAIQAIGTRIRGPST
jgi:hypothetical protein